MKYLHELSRRNVTVGALLLLVIGILRPTFEHVHLPTHNKDLNTQASGIDVSHHQGKIDWQSVKESDRVHFAFVKVTESVNYIDPQSTTNAKALRELDIPFGNYHFFHPNRDPERQAKFFLKNISKPVILPPVLDVEIVQSASPTELRNGVTKWLVLVEQEIGCTPIIYTDLYFWQTYFAQGFERYPLWLAEYRPHLYIPPTMKRWNMWQKTDSGDVPGIRGSVDLNQLNRNQTSLEDMKC